MVGNRLCLGAALLFGGLIPQAVAGDELAAPKAPLTVADMIDYAQIGNHDGLAGVPDHPALADYSPDRRHAAIVVYRGNAARQSDDAKLLVYATDELLKSAKPIIVASFSSRTNYNPIAHVRWIDNRTLVFAGTSGDRSTQVYKARLAGDRPIQLTHARAQIQYFDVSADGAVIVALNAVPPRPMDLQPDCARVGCLVPQGRYLDGDLAAVEYGVYEGSLPLSVFGGKKARHRTLAVPEAVLADIDFCPYPTLEGNISPDGRFALRRCRRKPASRPQWWSEYEHGPNPDNGVTKLDFFTADTLVATDLGTGRTYPVLDAPYLANFMDDVSQIVWIDGGKRFLIIGGFEALTGSLGAERARRTSTREVLEVDPISRNVQIVGALPLGGRYKLALWDSQTQTLVLSKPASKGSAASVPALAFWRDGGRWEPAAIPQATRETASSVGLELVQDLNSPPKLFAVDAGTGARKLILDPNPWLARRKFGKVEVARWTGRNGVSYQAGLYYPSDYVEGQRYPLVIQTHGFSEDSFSMTGNSQNDNARALATNGIMVLQVPDPQILTGANERQDEQLRYESAINELDRRGLIDRSKVGLQGWSRTGGYVAYTLTHSSYPFAAAAFTSSGTFGLWERLIWEEAAVGFDILYGAKPYGPNLTVWAKADPDLNIDHAQTPTMIWENGPQAEVASMWDWYEGLRMQGVPVEQWYFADGMHEVYKASQRLRTTQLLVDWYRFWLKGEEDSDPHKAEQYGRWEEMRSNWQKKQAADTVH